MSFHEKTMAYAADKMKVMETLHDGDGRLLAAGDGHRIVGQVEVIYRSKRGGKTIFTHTIDENDLLVNGAVFLSEKINAMRSGYKPTPLDVSLGVHTIDNVDRTAATVPQEKICGIMIGNGGCGDTYNTVHRVHRTDLSVPNPIPFRVVPVGDDLTGDARKRYFLRTVKGDYVYYYGKNFDETPEINVQYEDGRVIPENPASSDGDLYTKIFTKYSVTLDAYDVREYFKHTEGSTLRSLVNSVGLITGYVGEAADDTSIDEFFNVRGMTTLNMENRELKDSESTITFVYRLYFV